MKPGDLRAWSGGEDPTNMTFMLIERVFLLNTVSEQQFGWKILEGGEVKERYEVIVENFSRPVE